MIRLLLIFNDSLEKSKALTCRINENSDSRQFKLLLRISLTLNKKNSSTDLINEVKVRLDRSLNMEHIVSYNMVSVFVVSPNLFQIIQVIQIIQIIQIQLN